MSVQLKEYTDRFPNKEAWYKYHITIGCYLPKETCFKWSWGIEKGLRNLRKFITTTFFNYNIL